MQPAHRGGETTRAREGPDTVSSARRMALETVNRLKKRPYSPRQCRRMADFVVATTGWLESSTDGPTTDEGHRKRAGMSNMKRTPRTSPLAKAAALGVALATLASGQQAFADAQGRAQARRMYDRLTGTPPA